MSIPSKIRYPHHCTMGVPVNLFNKMDVELTPRRNVRGILSDFILHFVWICPMHRTVTLMARLLSWLLHNSVVNLGGCRAPFPVPMDQFFLISCCLSENVAKLYVGASFWGFVIPSTENLGSYLLKKANNFFLSCVYWSACATFIKH